MYLKHVIICVVTVLLIASCSKAKDAANRTISKLYPSDLKGRDRFQDGGPDIGAFERQEKKAQ